MLVGMKEAVSLATLSRKLVKNSYMPLNVHVFLLIKHNDKKVDSYLARRKQKHCYIR